MKPVITDFGIRKAIKVDMSPKAVTERLKTMDELWLLSVELMNSKKIRSAEEIELSDQKQNEYLYQKEVR